MDASRREWLGRPARQLLAFLPALTFLLLPACTQPAADPVTPEVAGEEHRPLFEDVTAAAGLHHTYRNGEEADHLAILESLGGGAALLDYDGDGLLDVFLAGGGRFDGPGRKAIRGLPCRLFHNQGGLHFRDVTREAGLDGLDFYSHGAAAADYDRDGYPDLLVTGYGRLALLHNEPSPQGGRRFADVTRTAGLTDGSWSSSAAWADLDGDGHVDCYVCRYLDWSWANHPRCQYEDGKADLCPPHGFTALPDTLYRNNGDGTFTDVSRQAGLVGPRAEQDYKALSARLLASARARLRGRVPDQELERGARQAAGDALDRLRRADAEKAYGKGLGVLLVDVNADGKPDVYVANDAVDNFLYVNRGGPGKMLFEEVGLAAGVARDGGGLPNGSMGVDAADYAGEGRPSLWVVNYENERHALYHHEGGDGPVFRYATQAAGIAALGQAYVGWGTGFVDFDRDGWEDLFVSNGHAYRFPRGRAGQAQRPVLLLNLPGGRPRRFQEVGRQRGGEYFLRDHRGRGVAFGDLDNDGGVDLVLVHLNEPTALLRAVPPPGRRWLGVELRRQGRRDPVGARIVLEAGGRRQTRFCKGGGSYASASDSRHVFGLGEAERADRLTVVWPTGREQSWTDLAADRYWVLTEGEPGASPAPQAR